MIHRLAACLPPLAAYPRGQPPPRLVSPSHHLHAPTQHQCADASGEAPLQPPAELQRSIDVSGEAPLQPRRSSNAAPLAPVKLQCNSGEAPTQHRRVRRSSIATPAGFHCSASYVFGGPALLHCNSGEASLQLRLSCCCCWASFSPPSMAAAGPGHVHPVSYSSSSPLQMSSRTGGPAHGRRCRPWWWCFLTELALAPLLCCGGRRSWRQRPIP